MRTASLTALTTALLASTAAAQPTTQACLGDLHQFLTCPPGASVIGTECRAREPHGGAGPGEHWSGSRRQGPALFLRDGGARDPAVPRVALAARYVDHRKTGRVFRFDPQGVLTSWDDLDADQLNGLSVSCLPDGRIAHLAYYHHDRVVGVSRAWRSRDGAFSYAMQYDADGHPHAIDVPAALRVRPDALCQPTVCDVHAAAEPPPVL
jgi:hypothetical protein